MSKFYDKYKTEITALLIMVGILLFVHSLFIFGDIYNRDSVHRFIRPGGVDYVMSSGRWSYGLYRLIEFNGNTSALIQASLAGLWFGMSSIILSNILFTKRSLKVYEYVFMGLPVVGMFVLVPFFLYGSDLDVYAFSIFISILGSYLYINSEQFSLKKLLSFILVAISIGVYQSFFHFFLVPIVMYWIINVNEMSFKDLIIELVKLFISAIIIAIIYLIFLNLSLYITGSELSTYHGADEMGIIDILANFKNLFIYPFIMFYNFMFGNIYKVPVIIVFVLNLFLLFSFIKHDKKLDILKRLLLMLIVIMLLFYVVLLEAPLGDRYFRVLRFSGIMLYFVFINYYIVNLKSGTFKNIFIIVSLVFVYTNIILTNQFYQVSSIALKNLETRNLILASEVISTDGYTKDKTVYFDSQDTIDSIFKLNNDNFDTSQLFGLNDKVMIPSSYEYDLLMINRLNNRQGIGIKYKILEDSSNVPTGQLKVECDDYCLISI